MKHYNEDGDRYDSDNPEETEESAEMGLAELIDMIDQKLANKPVSAKLLKIWKGEVNNLVSDINKRSGRKMYLPV